MPKARPREALERAAEVRHILTILQKWGIRTLGQLAALPPEEVRTRLGPVALQMWERASGRATRLLQLVQPAEALAESFEFENEIETVEPLLFMLRRFLQQLSARLSALYLVAAELKLQITFSDKTSYEHLFQIPAPSNQEEVLFRMLHTHLEDFSSAAPIVAVALEVTPARPAQQQFGLFETALRDPRQLAETLARLMALLGAERVGRPVLQDSHRPEAWRLEPFAWQLPETLPPTEEETMAWALRRFRPPLSSAVLRAEEEPVHLRSSEVQGAVQEHEGPYKSSGNWWEQSASWARAEWDLELEHGALCRCHEEAETWQLDGIYD